MRELRVTSGNARLDASIWGDGDPPMVALHAGVADRRSWQWCAPAWAAAGHRVVAYDRRGFGTTDYVAEDHDEIADLRAVTAATDTRPAIVVGNSQGGRFAIDLALDHPDEVSALVLIAPSPTGYDESRWPLMPQEAALDEQIEAAEADDDLELLNRLEVRYWLDGVAQPEGRVAGTPRELMFDMNGRALRAAPAGDDVDRPPAWPRLAELTMPVLVVGGEHDLDGCRQLCDEMVATVPGAHGATIEGAAHCPHLDQPEQLNQVILDFLTPLTN
jgi:pimeloyl-ACP methyl ester carboxylesterase